jgi:hypothetical protein
MSGVILRGLETVGQRWASAWNRRADKPAQVQPLAAGFWMLAAVAAAAAAIWVTTAWLLDVADDPSIGIERATVRVDAVRTGLAAGAGAGAAVGLMLAFRRQRHQEIASVLSNHDAAERRVTELYTQAADQLGSDKAPVRLAGFYALERLAQDNPAHRQTIVDVICAYLRMPYTEPPELDIPTGSTTEEAEQLMRDWSEQCRTDEQQVRMSAEDILTSHLKPGDGIAPNSRFWDDMRINLQGAFLIQPDFSHCKISDAEFSAATFKVGVSFNYATFTGAAHFGGVTVRAGAGFRGATFLDAFSFYKTSVGWYADFREATFTRWVTFQGATTPEEGATSHIQGFPAPGFDLTGAKVSTYNDKAIWPAGWRSEQPQPDGWRQIVRAADDKSGNG